MGRERRTLRGVELHADRVAEIAHRPVADLRRRDVAIALLSVPAEDALTSLPVIRRGSSSSSSSNPTGDQREQASGSVSTVSTLSGVPCTVVAVLQVAIALLGTFTVSSRVPRGLGECSRAGRARIKRGVVRYAARASSAPSS